MATHSAGGSKRDKIVRDALTLAAKRVVEGDPQARIALAIAAEKVVEAAVNGDLASFREMADRIDGKSIQATESTVDVNVTHIDARQRLGRKLHAVVEPRAEDKASIITH